MLRTAKPKLSLAVPSAGKPALSLKSPMPRTPISPSPISPTARNTRMNARGYSTLQAPTYMYAQPTTTKGILKKGASGGGGGGQGGGSKKLSFRDEPSVYCVTPVPEDYHGTYMKMSRDERRWGRGY